MQGNSVMALAGLASVVSQFKGNVKKDSDDQEVFQQYLSTKEWLLKVADTLMAVLDGNFKPKSEPFKWCQQVSKECSQLIRIFLYTLNISYARKQALFYVRLNLSADARQ